MQLGLPEEFCPIYDCLRSERGEEEADHIATTLVIIDEQDYE